MPAQNGRDAGFDDAGNASDLLFAPLTGAGLGPRSIVGASRTTDAPFQQTVDVIEGARSKGILAVEMEAAARYAFARAATKLCISS